MAVDDVLFCADAVFPEETIQKHKVLFCVDLEEALGTLGRLSDLPYARFPPGHGPSYAQGEPITAICAANRNRLDAVQEAVYRALHGPQGTSDLVQQVADRFELRITTATAYFLTRTTVLAALSSLERAGEAQATMEANRLLWRKR